MGLFGKKKTPEELLTEGRAQYETGDIQHMFLTLHGLANKGNPEACYYIGYYWLKEKSDKHMAEKFLTIAAKGGQTDAAKLLAEQFGVRDFLPQEPEFAPQPASKPEPAPQTVPAPKPAPQAAPKPEPAPQTVPAPRPAPKPAPASVPRPGDALTPEQQSAKQDAEQGFEPLELNGANVQAIFDRCAKLGEDKKITWDKEALQQNRPNIRYFLGQLALVHEGVKEHKLSTAFFQRYDGTRWAANDRLANMLLTLGVSFRFCRTGIKDGTRMVVFSEEVKPTFLPSDPQFAGWKASCTGLLFQAEAAKVAKKDREALLFYEKAANMGDAGAQFHCGSLYYTGAGTAEDKKKALCWFEKAAQQGHADAQSNCGWMYANGEGTAEDKAKALYWYEKAAQQGNSSAQFHCGELLYNNGEGTPEDKAKALSWYEKAAQQGNAEAQYNMAQMYLLGGGPKGGLKIDDSKALYWHEKAAQQGYAPSQYWCGLMYDAAKDKAKALYWLEKAAEQGDAESQAVCGLKYHKGEGTAVDMAKALYWFEKAARQGYAEAQFYCGRMYYKGEGTAKDKAKAKMWIQEAAAQTESKKAQKSAKEFLENYF